MEAKITCVYDEGALPDTGLIGAKGFSVLVEVDGKRTLFDTGRRGRYLLHNLDELDIDCDSIDFLVISHETSSHTGGLPRFMSRRTEPLVIYGPSDLQSRKTVLRKPFLPPGTEEKALFMESDSWVPITDRLALSPPDGCGERFLLLATAKGPVVVAACCHCGILPVLSAAEEKAGAKPHALVGGTHLHKRKRADIAEVAAEIKNRFGNVRMALNHCTGYEGINGMREVFGLRGVDDFYAGMSMSFKTSPERPDY